MLLRELKRCVSSLKIKQMFIGLVVVMLTLFLIDLSGVLRHVQERDYFREFTYPLEGDVAGWVELRKAGKQPPGVRPINPHDYTLLKNAKGKCVEPDGKNRTRLRLVYVVKSALTHADRRSAIRRSWGYERRFADVEIRTVFLLGSPTDDVVDGVDRDALQREVDREYQQHRDIVQGSFHDTYFNNTLKAMMGLRWAVEQCPSSRFYLFVDDDYYVSTRNVLRFLRNPTAYPAYLEEPVLSFDGDVGQPPGQLRGRKVLASDADDEGSHRRLHHVGRKLQQMVDFDLPDDVRLYAGYVFHSPPHRHRLSKWFVELHEYPFHLWPPYVTAGAYVLSKSALVDMYYASYYVERFRFDDIYVGLLAKKLDIEPFHSDEFYFDYKPYNVKDYRYVVASHGFSDPRRQEKVWNEQKQAGNA